MIREETLGACTPTAFKNALTDQGIIILRSAINRGKLWHIKAQLERALAFYASLTESEIATLDYDRWWGAGNSPAFQLHQAHNGYISDPMLADATEGAVSFYDLISDPAFHALLAGAFPGLIFRKSTVTHCRRIRPDHQHGWGTPVPLHCDLRYHRDGPFALNFWVPFDPAGGAFGRPGLEIASIGPAAMARYLESNGAALPTFNERKFEIDEFERSFGIDALERPNLDLGDVMVFTSWTLHRTYIPKDASDGRLSAEVRMFTDTLPINRSAPTTG